MKKIFFCTLLAGFSTTHAQQNLVQYFKPILRTEKMEHTYPDATVSFGTVQLSPEADIISYKLHGKYNGDVNQYCAGYNYEDKTIVDFNHIY